MKVKFGGGITDARGSVGGVTFSRNTFGPYQRARVTPINPNTARQVMVRSSLAFLSNRWAATLTAAQRASWGLYGSNVAMQDKLGATIYLSGYNHYIRSNIILKMTSRTIIDAGPVIFELPAKDPTYAITASEATQQITTVFDSTMDWSVETNGHLFGFQGQPQNAQRNFFDGPWRGINAIDGIDPGGAVSPDVAASFWGIAEGQHLWNYARISRADGRLSAPFRDDTFCTA